MYENNQLFCYTSHELCDWIAANSKILVFWEGIKIWGNYDKPVYLMFLLKGKVYEICDDERGEVIGTFVAGNPYIKSTPNIRESHIKHKLIA